MVSKNYFKNIQKHSADAVKIVMDNKQHLGKLMRASLPSCGRMGLVCRWVKITNKYIKKTFKLMAIF